MKKHFRLAATLIALVPALFLSLESNAQKTADLFNPSTNIVWLGVDFTQARLIGDLMTVSPQELIPLFNQINQVIVNESDKYNFAKALRKSHISNNLDPVEGLNAQIDAEKMIETGSAPSNLNPETIANLIKAYNPENGTGIGLVFFMESLNKPSEKGTMWVTFFDIESHKLLLTERMSGKASGIGFRNHWARPEYEVIKAIMDVQYNKWKAKYKN
jgi:hypothetical protein